MNTYQPEPQTAVSDKKFTTAVILAGLFGTMGIHHFYVGRLGMGLLDVGMFAATCYFFFHQQYAIAGIILLVDIIHTVFVTYMLFTGQYKDGKGNIIPYPGQQL